MRLLRIHWLPYLLNLLLFTTFTYPFRYEQTDITYRSYTIRSLCLEAKKAIRFLGAESARKLQRRLPDLRAARSILELPTGCPHPYKGRR